MAPCLSGEKLQEGESREKSVIEDNPFPLDNIWDSVPRGPTCGIAPGATGGTGTRAGAGAGTGAGAAVWVGGRVY